MRATRDEEMQVLLEGHGARVSIGVGGFENRLAENIDDATWLSCDLVVSVPGFRAEFPASFRTHDFVTFRALLADLIEGRTKTVAFSAAERALRLDVTLTPRGHVRVHGIASFSSTCDAELSFRFDADLTFLRETFNQISDIVGAIETDRGENV